MTAAGIARRLPPEVLVAAEVHALMAGCSSRAPTGIRNRALIAVLWRSGLRLGEALALRPKDIDPVRGSVSVLHGKGDKHRTIGMDPQAFAVVERWLETRRRLGIDGRAPVFCTLRGGELAQPYVRTLLPRLARKAGVAKRVHAHGLRHTCAFELAGEGMPPHLIQQHLGHSSLATTDRYLRHLGLQEVIDAGRKRDWPAP
jgi:site-specific recombinase XerD